MAEGALAEMLDYLDVAPGEADGTWIGAPPAWEGEYLFGGFVLAQAIAAATRAAPERARLHSLHAYFLRPVSAAHPTSYACAEMRRGRAFATHVLEAGQLGKQVLTMTCSFTADTDGYVYDLPPADAVPTRGALEAGAGPGPWVAAFAGPTDPQPDGTRRSTHRMWFRVPERLPDDVHLHTALMGFATDWTGIGGRPLHLEGDTTGMVSLDHAAWFHRPPRADEWSFSDVHSLVNTGGRGLLRGAIRDEAGRVVASMAQEMRLTPVDVS